LENAGRVVERLHFRDRRRIGRRAAHEDVEKEVVIGTAVPASRVIEREPADCLFGIVEIDDAVM
jgi:hypothetical protein